MYRLSASEDLSFFTDATLLQVCVGRNELILNFDPHIRLTILSDFAVESPTQAFERFEDPIDGAPKIFALLHETTIGANATHDGHLRIQFSSGHNFVVFDTSNEYESFTITSKVRQIVV